MRFSLARAALLSTVATGLCFPVAVAAQTTDDAAASTAAQDTGEILVTARKREETLISVPVAVTALDANMLAARAINSADDVARLVPGMVLGEGGGTLQGGALSLRGIGASEANTLSEQAVSFNFDGVQIARTSPRRLGDFDIAQVEVLKGPQSLFYGKNSPGGIITYRSKDPTDTFEAGGKLGYEFNAREIRGEAYVSGPVADGLGARLAVYGSDMRGWMKNTLDPSYAYAPDTLHSTNRWEFAVRGTLKFDDGGPFRARAKFTYNKSRDRNGATGTTQFIACPLGAPQSGTVDDCRGDDRISNGGPGLLNQVNPDFRKDDWWARSFQLLGSLELNYDITDQLTLTSITGYYKYGYNGASNFTSASTPAWTLAGISDSNHPVRIREFSQELRLASDFDGPVNFTVGGTYGDTKGTAASAAYLGTNVGGKNILGGASGSKIVDFFIEQEGKSASVFGQLQVEPFEGFEISGGGRYTHEEKEVVDARNLPDTSINLVGVVPTLSNGNQKVTFNEFTPEVTVSYRPTRDLNVYGSWKRGFLSGGFNGGSFTPTNVSYAPQKVEGFEAGVKANLFNNTLRLDLAAYTYKIKGLQVQVTEVVSQVIKNAATVRTKGIELGANWRTPVDGLSLSANLAYAKGKYLDYFASCLRGQAAPECVIRDDGTPSGSLLQDLGGTELMRLPKWAGNVGFDYKTDVSNSLKLMLSGGMTFSDSYLTDAASNPYGRQPSYQLYDATITLADVDDKWDISLIGRNLSNEFYWVRSVEAPFTGTAPGNAARTPADTLAAISRGRQIMVRVGFKY